MSRQNHSNIVHIALWITLLKFLLAIPAKGFKHEFHQLRLSQWSSKFEMLRLRKGVWKPWRFAKTYHRRAYPKRGTSIKI